MERIMAGPERKGKILSEQEREVVAYHEAGRDILGRRRDQLESLARKLLEVETVERAGFEALMA